jgi:hypothetical protein
MNRFLSIAVLAFISLFLSCNSGPGPGGQASITGKVWSQNWNSNLTIMQAEGYGPNIDVYLIYGDDPSYGDRVKTGPDGTYQFKYLRKGKYKVYAYSYVLNQPTTDSAIVKEIEITDKKQAGALDDFHIKVKN